MFEKQTNKQKRDGPLIYRSASYSKKFSQNKSLNENFWIFAAGAARFEPDAIRLQVNVLVKVDHVADVVVHVAVARRPGPESERR